MGNTGVSEEANTVIEKFPNKIGPIHKKPDDKIDRSGDGVSPKKSEKDKNKEKEKKKQSEKEKESQVKKQVSREEKDNG